MSTEESLRIAEELYEAFNAHDLDRVEESTSESFVGVGPDSPEARKGRTGGRNWAAMYINAFPDCKWMKERIFAQDDLFALQVIFTGTNTGPLEAQQTIPPTNKGVRVPATFVGIAQNGKIEELRGYWDQLTLLGQLGLVPQGP